MAQTRSRKTRAPRRIATVRGAAASETTTVAPAGETARPSDLATPVKAEPVPAMQAQTALDPDSGTDADAAVRPKAVPDPQPGLARSPRPTKILLVQRLLRSPEGVSLPTLEEATGWQPHTLRAALTRLRQAGHPIERSRSEDGATVYRIVEQDGEPAEGETPDPEDQPAAPAGASAGVSA